MSVWLHSFLLFAEEAAEEAPARPQGNFLTSPLFPIMTLVFIWYFIVIRPKAQEGNQRRNLLDNLRKNDQVITIGGIVGTVASVSSDKKFVVLKMEDGAKIKMTRSSIHTFVNEEEAKARHAAEKDHPAEDNTDEKD